MLYELLEDNIQLYNYTMHYVIQHLCVCVEKTKFVKFVMKPHESGSTPGVLTVSFFLVPVCTNKYPVGTNLVKLVPAGTNRMLYLRT